LIYTKVYHTLVVHTASPEMATWPKWNWLMILRDNLMSLTIISAQLAGQAAPSLPRNPERPLNPTTCEEALARVEEAARENPLISPEENKRVLREAVATAERLCSMKL
jgi:hypothetical protein